MLHSINLCAGTPNLCKPGWDKFNGEVRTGGTVGVLVDSRRNKPEEETKQEPGASIYFIVNGEFRPVAFTGITESLHFAVAITKEDTISIVQAAKMPTIPLHPH